MPFVVVKVANAVVFMLKLAISTAAKREKGGVAANPLITTPGFDQRGGVIATKPAALAGNRFGFRAIIGHVQLLFALGYGRTHPKAKAMSSTTKLRRSRAQWKEKATARGQRERYLRKENGRLKQERDRYQRDARAARKQLVGHLPCLSPLMIKRE
jgi:hypothetical protein